MSTPAESEGTRKPILVRAGLSLQRDGTLVASEHEQLVVRSTDSAGKLAAFVIPLGENAVYRGAPLHVHHEVDEWLYVLGGEFVAEVGGERMRLRAGDSLLMPMKIPHRWSIAGLPISGAIHLYTPAGAMGDADADEPITSERGAPRTRKEIAAEFAANGMTLLGDPLTREEIDQVI